MESTTLYRLWEDNQPSYSIGGGLLIHLHRCGIRRNITPCLSRTLEINTAHGVLSDIAHRHHHGNLYIPIVIPFLFKYTFEPGYNDIGLCNTLPIPSDILWYQLIPHF